MKKSFITSRPSSGLFEVKKMTEYPRGSNRNYFRSFVTSEYLLQSPKHKMPKFEQDFYVLAFPLQNLNILIYR